MNPDIDTYGRYIRKQIEEILGLLEGMSEKQLNHRPSVDGANSAFVIATHVLGNARSFVLGIASGQALRRDRPAEFASFGTYQDLRGAADRLLGEIEDALRRLDPGKLDERSVPPQELWGEGKAEEISRREALMHVVEHAAMHLGQVHLTRDIAVGEVGS